MVTLPGHPLLCVRGWQAGSSCTELHDGRKVGLEATPHTEGKGRKEDERRREEDSETPGFNWGTASKGKGIRCP